METTAFSLRYLWGGEMNTQARKAVLEGTPEFLQAPGYGARCHGKKLLLELQLLCRKGGQ
jgi:hypothetical protein